MPKETFLTAFGVVNVFSDCQFANRAVGNAYQVVGRQLNLHSANACAYVYLVVQNALFVKVCRIFLLHPDRRATAPNVASVAQKFLYVNHCGAFVARSLCGFFQVNFFGARNHADEQSSLVATQD